jgi:hypothetical protein
MIPGLNNRLVWYTPHEVWKSIHAFPVKQWHRFIEDDYEPQNPMKVCVLVQCAGPKPYPRAFTIRQVLNAIQEFKNKLDIAVVSEPFAIEPEEYWSLQWTCNGRRVNLLYDCPGLMKWWVTSQFGKGAWDADLYNRTADHIGAVIRSYFERLAYEHVILYAVTETHRDFVSRADFGAIILPRGIDRLHTRMSFGKGLSALRLRLRRLLN